MKNVMTGFWLLVLLLTQFLIGKGAHYQSEQLVQEVYGNSAHAQEVTYEVQE